MKKIIEAKALKTINIHLHTPIAIYINNIYYPNKDTTAIHSHYGERKKQLVFKYYQQYRMEIKCI